MAKPKEFQFKQNGNTVFTTVYNEKTDEYLIQWIKEKPRYTEVSNSWMQNNNSIFKLDGSGKW
jgi:hypothetical protein